MLRLVMAICFVVATTSAAGAQELRAGVKLVLIGTHTLVVAKPTVSHDKKWKFGEGDECSSFDAPNGVELEITRMEPLWGFAIYRGRDQSWGHECPTGTEIIATRDQFTAWLENYRKWLRECDRKLTECISQKKNRCNCR